MKDSRWLIMSRIGAHYGVKVRGYSPEEIVQKIRAREVKGEITVSVVDKVELNKIAQEGA